MSKEKQNNTNLQQKPWLRPLLDYFKAIRKHNDKIESIRQKLCQSDNFNVNELFYFLDFRKNDFLTSKNLIHFLNQSNTPYEEQYIRCLVHNYDKDGDFTLNKTEFLNMILPIKQKNLRDKQLSIINNTNDSYENNDVHTHYITNDIKRIFIELIKEELNLAETAFYVVKNIYGSPKFTTYDAFVDIVKKESYITRQNLGAFLKENDCILDDDDIYMLMFRIDSDNDNRISYVEFQDIFYPIKKYSKYNDNNDDGDGDVVDGNEDNLNVNSNGKNNYNKRNKINNNLYNDKLKNNKNVYINNNKNNDISALNVVNYTYDFTGNNLPIINNNKNKDYNTYNNSLDNKNINNHYYINDSSSYNKDGNENNDFNSIDIQNFITQVNDNIKNRNNNNIYINNKNNYNNNDFNNKYLAINDDNNLKDGIENGNDFNNKNNIGINIDLDNIEEKSNFNVNNLEQNNRDKNITINKERTIEINKNIIMKDNK